MSKLVGKGIPLRLRYLGQSPGPSEGGEAGQRDGFQGETRPCERPRLLALQASHPTLQTPGPLFVSPGFHSPEIFRVDSSRLTALRKGRAYYYCVRDIACLCQLSFSVSCIFSGLSSRQRKNLFISPGPRWTAREDGCPHESQGPGLQISAWLPAVSLTLGQQDVLCACSVMRSKGDIHCVSGEGTRGGCWSSSESCFETEQVPS